MNAKLRTALVVLVAVGLSPAQDGGRGEPGHRLPQGPHVDWAPTGDGVALAPEGVYEVQAGAPMPFVIGTDQTAGQAYLFAMLAPPRGPIALDLAYAALVFSAPANSHLSIPGSIFVDPALTGLMVVGRAYLKTPSGAVYASEDVVVRFVA